MRTIATFVIIAWVAMGSSCSLLKPFDAKVEAHGRWNRLQAGVKLQLAQQHHQSGLFKEAIKEAMEALALEPKQAEAYALLAECRLELGQEAAAERTLDAADAAGVTSARLGYARGVILELRDDLAGAAAQYEKVRALDADYVDALAAQVECLVAMDRPEEARALIEGHARAGHHNGTLDLLAAHVAGLTGDVREASDRLRRAALANPNNPIVTEDFGRLLVKAGRYERALAILQPLLESDRELQVRGALRRAVATCHLALGNAADARDALAGYAAKHPEDTLAQLLLAKAALALNDWMTALRAVDLAGQREPDRPELWLVRAAVQWKRGNLAAAASDLYDVLQNNPDDVEAHCLMGEVLRAQKRPIGAREHFQRALALNPSFAWATAGLESVRKAKRDGPLETTAKLTAADATKQP